MVATSEKSLITILVVDTVGSTEHVAACDPDDAQAFLDRIFSRIERAVVSSSGHLVSFAGDGGVAVFGWPDSLENHAAKACQAALRITEAGQEAIVGPDGRQARFRIGIHSGLVVLRQITLEGVRRLDTVGGTVHMAAALEKRAPPNGIVISESTLSLCERPPAVDRFEDIPIFAKMGIRTYIVVPDSPADADAPAAAASFVGRRDELRALERALPRPGGDFSSVAIIGEPGIGKSRLLSAIAASAARSDIRVLRFDAGNELDPYIVFRSFLRSTLAKIGATRETLGELAHSDPEFGADDRLMVDAVLEGNVRRNDISYRPSQMQIVRAIIRALLRLNGATPLLLIVDDLQAVDLESLSCLSELALNTAPRGVSLFVSARGEAAAAAREFSSVTLRLEPLGDDEMTEIARSLPNGQSVAGDRIEKAVRKADGVPFVLEQIMLSGEGEGGDGFDPLPLRVHSLIHARFNTLSAEAKELAQGLSVLSEPAELDFLSVFFAANPRALEARIRELERMGFVRLRDDGAVQFCHAILADACLTTIPSARRRELHLKAIESSLSVGKAHRYDILAHHYEGAEQFNEAIECLWKAGLHARRSSAMGTLQLIVKRAFNCIDRVGDSERKRYIDFVLMAAPSLLQIGEFAFIKPHLHHALALAEQRGTTQQLCSALSQLATLRWFEGDYSAGLDNSRRAVERADQLNSLPHRFAAGMVHSILLWITADIEGAIAIQSELCASLTGNLENSRLGAAAMPSVMARTFMAWALTDIGRYDRSLEVGREALAIARRTGDPYAAALALSAIGNTQIVKGHYADACETLGEGHALCLRNGYHTSLPTVVGNLSIALARLGRQEEGEEISRNWFERNDSHRTGHFELIYAMKGRAEALGANGRVDEGLAVIGDAWLLAKRVDSPSLQLRLLETRIRILEGTRDAAGQLAADRAEMEILCQRHGLVAQA